MIANSIGHSPLWIRHIALLVASVSVLSSCTSHIVIPMYRHDFHDENPSYWVEGRINGRNVNLLVDTGSSLPAISKDFVQRYNLDVSAAKFQNPDGGETEIDVVRPGQFSVGKLRTRESVFFVLDTVLASEIVQREVDGIVGGGFFNGNRYSISFKDNFISYGRFSIENINMHPLEIVQQYLYAEVNVNGIVDKFIIDSGGLQTQISMDLAERALGDLSNLVFSDRVRITVDGISNVRVAHAIVPSFSFGDVLVKDFPVLISDYTRNIIGIDLLKNGILTIDPDSESFGFEFP